ncbi:FecR family protein [Sphingobacterium sp. UGAL515B_05]|uniref:FecR family protein n=1 Tax=Sphingobacterium sp. UGAL515B_05 TaxID=2986767 RepID=UPI002952D773|nr:FecR domain-containing protein [Sphingobacterium sp. UGAL515B_05]WON94951.1 FecR domain-containing protein [Sphingobacterium sp. UGAL515B_05]
METNKSKIDQLLQKYKEGNCSLEEIEWLQHALSATDIGDQDAIDQAIVTSLLQPSAAGKMSESRQKIVLGNIKKQIQQGTQERDKPKFSIGWPYWAAAACLLLFIFTMLFWQQQTSPVQADINLVRMQDTTGDVVNPGGNSATLRLANGTLLELDKQASGIVMGESITYENGKSIAAAALDKQAMAADPSKLILELATPLGGIYQITLPDGTKVWLNAGSSLKYPMSFAKNERRVRLEGEAFFEVTKDSARPFKVLSKGQEIEVLGTAFNVNAYPDNTAIKTTLVKGKVKLSNNNRYSEAIYLLPGQQSTNTNNGKIQLANVDTAPFTAWKEGLFYFDETPLSDALQQIGRWYNVEVKYKGEVPQTHFYGRIKRSKPLREVLDVLEEGGLRFELSKSDEKNILYVRPL